jgi:membrane-bound serine protease (ClpP class)
MFKRLGLPIRVIALLLFVFLTVSEPPVRAAQSSTSQVLVLTADGPLTPAMAEYLERGILTAEQRGAVALILKLNTPGGNLALMNRMVEDIRASSVPVVVYVSPDGAMAGSAGSLITMAGQAAAMAPGTAIGAASPVGPSGEDLTTTEELKQKEILTATARSLTEQRGPQAVALAQDMIQNAKAVSANEALDAGLVDFVANDVTDLLRQLDGFQVMVGTQPVVLHTAFTSVSELPQTFIEQLLATLTDPNIVLLLINVGVVAILIEISSPGGWVAGFIGVVCLALATYGLDILPVNWFGVVFLILAFVLFLLDIKAPTHGALTAAGIASLTIGGLVLFNSPNVPNVQRVSVPLALASSTMTGALFFGILLFALRAQKTPLRTGQQTLIGRIGTVTADLSPRGHVQLGGELWTAQAVDENATLPTGTRVQVVGVEGVKLLVQEAGK